ASRALSVLRGWRIPHGRQSSSVVYRAQSWQYPDSADASNRDASKVCCSITDKDGVRGSGDPAREHVERCDRSRQLRDVQVTNTQITLYDGVARHAIRDCVAAAGEREVDANRYSATSS